MHTTPLRATSLVAILTLVLLTSRVSAQSNPALSVHATSDSLIVTLGSETRVISRDALDLLSSPEGYSQDALSLHVALLHGVLTEEVPPPTDDNDPSTEEDPLPTEQDPPILTLSTSRVLHTLEAERSAGNEGHEWENASLNVPVNVQPVQLLPDIGTRYRSSSGPQLIWEVEVADAGDYYLYAYAAGQDGGGNSVYVGTSEEVDRVDFSTRGQWEWVRKGPFTLMSGVREIVMRGREDGTYFAAIVASADPDLTDSDLDSAISGTDSGMRVSDQTKNSASLRTGSSVPEEFVIHAVYPNPTRGAAVARFDLPEAAEVDVEVFDALGRRVKEQRVSFGAGFNHTVSIGTASLTSGVYVVRVVARMASGERAKSQRFTVVQ
jgi:hypothetical protein